MDCAEIRYHKELTCENDLIYQFNIVYYFVSIVFQSLKSPLNPFKLSLIFLQVILNVLKDSLKMT